MISMCTGRVAHVMISMGTCPTLQLSTLGDQATVPTVLTVQSNSGVCNMNCTCTMCISSPDWLAADLVWGARTDFSDRTGCHRWKKLEMALYFLQQRFQGFAGDVTFCRWQ